MITHGTGLSPADALAETVPWLSAALHGGGCTPVTVLDEATAGAVLEKLAGCPPGRPVLLVRADVVPHPAAVQTLLTEPRGAAAVLVTDAGAGPAVAVEGGMLAPRPAVDPADPAGGAAVAPGMLLVRDTAVLTAAVTGLLARPAFAGRPAGDLPDLLAAALASSGAAVAAVRGDGYRVRRVRSAAEAAEAVAAVRAVDERRVRLAAAVKAEDSPFTTFLVSPWSRYLARWAAERGLTPNLVTVGSLLVGVAAAVAFAAGGRWWLVLGAVTLQASFALDCVDGQLARYARVFTPLGGWLDASFDRLKEYAVYAGLAVGSARGGDDVWLLAAAALGLQVFRHAVDFGFAVRQEARPARHAAGPAAGSAPGSAPGPAAAGGGEGAGGRPAPGAPGGPGAPASSAGTSTLTVLPVAGLGRGAVRLSARTSAHRPLVHLKRVVILPIGERWALISLCAALSGARAAFLAVLVWGGAAACYTLTGRVLRSVAGA